MLNAPVSPNLLDAANSVSGRGQAHVVNCAGKAGASKAKTGTGLFGVRPLCGGLDNTRPDGTARGYAGLVG